MKKFLIVLFTLLLSAGLGFGGDKTLTFQWEQDDSNLLTLDHWTLYQTSDPISSWPWTKVGDIPYDGNPGAVYTAPFTITAPDGQETSYWFKLTAVDNQNQESDPSEAAIPAPTVIDFKAPLSPALSGVYDASTMTVNLSWVQDASDLDVVKWEVYKRESGGTFLKVGESTNPAYAYNASGDNGKTLTFTTVAFDDDGNYSPNSLEVAFTILPVVPSTPFGLKVTVITQ